MMTEEVYTQTLAMAGELDESQKKLLQMLCTSVVASLEQRLREDVSAEECREAFLTAACLYALAALPETDGGIAEFKAGDLTVRQEEKADTGKEGLRQQAELLMRPYLQDSFAFMGV